MKTILIILAIAIAATIFHMGYEVGYTSALSDQYDSTRVDDFADHSELREGE